MSGTVIRDLAEWAEDRFSGFCAAAGVTRNKSTQDRTGWDYIVQFRSPENSDVPPDMLPGEDSALVQVKSKKTGRPTVSLKLTNALRFAKESGPCFLVLFLATNAREPVRIYAKHFWKQEIEDTLRRARLADQEGRTDLHKLMISVSFNENDEHGSDLLPWMAATIRAEHGRYNENKSTLSRSLGFEDGSIHGTISFAFKDLGALVDHQIGLTDNAPISEITIKHRRFGIDARKPIFSGKPDSAQIRSHPIPCRVRVRTFDDPDVWIPGSLFLPAVPGIRLELCKLRVVADFLDIVISGTGVASLNFSFDGAAQRTLSSLRNLIDVARYAERGLMQIQICSEKWPNLSLGGTLPLDWESDQVQQLSNAVSCLETIATDVLPTEFTILLVDVYAAWEAIGRLNGLATSSEMRGSFELDRPADLVVSPEAAIYFYDYVDVGQWTLLTVVRRPILQICKNESRYEFCFGKPRVAEALVRHGKGTDSLAELQVLYRQAVAIEKSKVLEIRDGDFCALYATCQSNEDRRETG